MISLGFSPCPNDTFIFYALANRQIDTQGLDFNLNIDDIETLNRRALEKSLDVTKISCHAFYYLQEDYRFLQAGAALGRGCGPLLVARDSEKFIKGTFSGELKIAIPGKLTTAFLLLQLFSSASGIQPSTFVAMPFYEIMEAVRDGRVDAGLLIHESRFTYQDYGLQQITDLGEWWEKETGLPIPLGGIIARESLGTSVIRTIENLIRTGIKYSLSHRDEAMSYIKKHSQELSEDVVMKHIALYVNDYTLDIGDDGLAALDELLKRAAKIFKN